MNKELTTGEKNAIIGTYIGHTVVKKECPVDYNNSYDMLMPVVKKVMYDLDDYYEADNIEVITEKDKTIYATQEAIRNKLKICYYDITPLYEATFNAIQYLNQLKQTQP